MQLTTKVTTHIVIAMTAFLLFCNQKSEAQTITNTNITIMGWYEDTLISPALQGTNYWLDFNLTNGRGYFIYQSVLATNSVYFLGVTNALSSRLLSVNVYSAGTGDRKIGISTNIVPNAVGSLTNGMTLEGIFYTRTLTNFHQFVISCKTNKNGSLETIWRFFQLQ